jgi:hypothetical protein
MSTTAMPSRAPRPRARDHDFLVRETFTDERWERFLATRRFVDDEVLAVINDYRARAELP